MAGDGDLEDGEERRTIAIANYWVKSEREREEAKWLAEQAGHKRFTHLVFKAVDAELARLREVYAERLAVWRQAQDRIAEMKG